MHPRSILAPFNIQPKKSLGQNFLFDASLLKKIVASADVQPVDHVLEIGPGLGALTRELAIAAQHVVAVELDNRLLPVLEYELAHFPNIQLIHGDILKVAPSSLFEQRYKVVANVPYYITGAILRHLLSADVKPTQVTLTVQKEVAERMTANPGSGSLMSISTQFYGRVSHRFNIAAGAFWPRPKVASAVVQIDLHDTPHDIDEKAFFRVAKAGFSQKRKQLKNNLRALQLSKDDVSALLDSIGFDGRRRAETLSVEEWVALANAVGQYSK